jgi:peroxiredoxin
MKKNYASLLALVALFVGLSAFMVGPNKGYKVGDTVQDFNLKNITEEMVSLKNNAGAKGAIVIFTCNHCPFSVKYEDRIIALHKKYNKLGYPVIAINPNDPAKEPDDSFAAMKVRAKEKGFTFPYIVDESQEVAKQFGAERTPHVYVVSKAGSEFKVSYIGAIDNNANDAKDATEKYVEQAVDALVAGKTVAKNSTKAIGCSIKWRKA